MNRRSQRLAIMATAGLTALGLAACSSSSGGSTNTGGTPVFGGTLKIVAAGGPTQLDTVPAYYTANYILERVYARQLLSYPAKPDPTVTSAGWTADVTPIPDIATSVPTTANGGVSADLKTYTFHIRQGVMWNSSPPRQVTADDFIREFKAFCNPVAPVGNLPYYSHTIAGLQTYCNAETTFFTNKKNAQTAANIAGFQNTHTISGITAVNSSTLQFHLIQPAGDFIYMLAMPFASARPVEEDSYIPASVAFDQHIVSDGPYQITSYVPGRSIVMQRNPAWKQSSDPIRHQYVKEITVTMGVTDAQTQLNDMQAGKFDMALDVGVLPSAIPTLLAKHDPKFYVWPWTSTVPYVAFNLRSPNSHHAMANVLLRQAIEYGISKVGVQKVVGGPTIAKVINTAIPPGNAGYQNYNLYPDNNGQGDTAKCKSVLAQAGFKGGVTLKYLYQNDSINSAIFQSIQASLKLCGINLAGTAESGGTFFTDVGNAPVNAKPGTFDMAQVGWIPDWFGANNGRTIIDPLFRTNCVLNTINYGCYSNKTVDGLINQAEATPNLTTSGNLWHQADMAVMKDAVIVPLVDLQAPFYSSKNVENAGSSAVVYTPNIGGPDLTNDWLKNG